MKNAAPMITTLAQERNSISTANTIQSMIPKDQKN